MKHTSPFLLYSFCLILGFLLSSFAWETVPPPAEKSTTLQQRHAKKVQRLQQRLARTQRLKVRHRLQQKIERFQSPATGSDKNRTLSIVGFILGLGGVLLFGASYLFVGFWALAVAIVSILFAIGGMTTSIGALLLLRHNKEGFGGRGFALAGLILSALIIGIVLVGFGQTALGL